MDKKRTGESLKDLFKREVGTKELSSQRATTLRRRSTKESKRQDVKTSKLKRKHTIYLSPEKSRKLRLYAVKNDLPLSEVMEKLINENL